MSKTGPRVSELDARFAGSCATCGALLDRLHLDESPDGLHCGFCGVVQEGIGDHASRPSASLGIGDTLREAREVRRESLEHAARETNINERYLLALEEDASPEAFPGEIYGRFFLREYAEYLGVVPGPLVRRYDRASHEPVVEPMTDTVLRRDPRRWNRLVTSIAVIALVAIGAVSWSVRGRHETASPAGVPAA
jgi:hypothetical protein